MLRNLISGAAVMAVSSLIAGCEVTELPPEPATVVEARIQVLKTYLPDSATWTVGTSTNQASLEKLDTLPGKVNFKIYVQTPKTAVDTLRFGVWSLGIRLGQIPMVPFEDGSWGQLTYRQDVLGSRIVGRLDSLARIPATGYARSRASLELLCARMLLDTGSLLGKSKASLPMGLSHPVLDSLALLEAAKGSVPVGILAKTWQVDMDSAQAHQKLLAWSAAKVPGVDSLALRRMVPPPNLVPEIVRFASDTPSVTLGKSVMKVLVELRDDSGLVARQFTVLQSGTDVGSFFSLDAPGLPTSRPTSWACTLKVATSTAAAGTYVLRIRAVDNKDQDTIQELSFQVAKGGGGTDPVENVAPTVHRLVPQDDVIQVSDTTSQVSLSWTVIDANQNLRQVTVNNQPVTLQGNLANLTLPVRLGDTTTFRLVAIDQNDAQDTNVVRVVRAGSVLPTVSLLSGKSRDTTLPDTQTTLRLRWKAEDTNLDSIYLDGKWQASASGQEWAIDVAMAPGTADTVRFQALDKLKSRRLDSVIVRRPDPRARWKSLLELVQAGADTVPTLPLRSGVRMGQFEVTRGLGARYGLAATPKDSAGYPATGMTFYEAVRFCNALSKARGMDTLYAWAAATSTATLLDSVRIRGENGLRGFRMATPGEMDTAFAAWGGPYPWGASVDAAYAGQFAVMASAGIRPVGSKFPTGPGYFDLAGNAGEWESKTAGYIGANTRWFVGGGDASTTAVTNFAVVRKETGSNRNDLTGMRLVRTGSD